MDEVTIRELRNHGGDVLDRVAGGQTLIVTRAGRPVAELRPVPRPPVKRDVLLQRLGRLPRMDARSLREDLDAIIDPTLWPR
jgi:prevent-host-death family protein